MRIGIDIDNVISNFDEEVLKTFFEHNRELGYDDNINMEADYITKGMFNWPEEETEKFYKNNIERIARNLKVKTGAKEYIDKLREYGHEIYIITGRDNGEYSEPIKMTITWLKDKGIYYDKIFFTNSSNHDKYSVCLENNVDIMIDDSSKMCLNCIKNGVDALLMNSPYNKNANLERVYNWKEIYEYISSKTKINVILDTDTYNECDDQFALSYLIKSQDMFNIEAITIAPFFHKAKNVTTMESQNLSYEEAVKLCNWLDFNTTKIYKGSTDYLSNGYCDNNDAVDKIIEVANKNDKTYIIAIGAITNVALAILKDPEIINKIEIIWLGGNELGYKDNLEYNFKQDISAVKTVFESKVTITILPCNEVVSNLKIGVDELKNNLRENDLNKYLIDRFYNDGYHGIQEERVIWDISAVAYLINEKWFETKNINTPIIKEDTSYKPSDNDSSISFVTKLDREEIYQDLFDKLNS